MVNAIVLLIINKKGAEMILRPDFCEIFYFDTLYAITLFLKKVGT